MRIAVEGCMHGELDKVYETIMHLQQVEKVKVDLLLCCGDFQAVRNDQDLESMSAPPTHKRMNSFWKYYSGEKVAPVPTIFIGGNHEASNYLWELYYGGFAAPNIYFLGFAGVVKFGNVRIGGLSGIYNKFHYHLGHYERLPYNQKDIRSVYHVREYDVCKLLNVEEPLDIFLSHDWPVGITDHGNAETLVREKPFFEKEVRTGTLGSPPAAVLLDKLKPAYWFSGHLHCRFAAAVRHGHVGGPVTKFLALDKCGPGRKFLQIIEVESGPGPFQLQYDEEWLTITKRFNSVLPVTEFPAEFRDIGSVRECRQFVRNVLQTRGAGPLEFVRTAPCYDPCRRTDHVPSQLSGHRRNPQTEGFLQLLQLEYLLDKPCQLRESPGSKRSLGFEVEDISLDDVDDEDEIDQEENDMESAN